MDSLDWVFNIISGTGGKFCTKWFCQKTSFTPGFYRLNTLGKNQTDFYFCVENEPRRGLEWFGGGDPNHGWGRSTFIQGIAQVAEMIYYNILYLTFKASKLKILKLLLLVFLLLSNEAWKVNYLSRLLLNHPNFSSGNYLQVL